MNKDELLQKIKEIGTIEDDAERREKLVELQDGVTHVFDDYEAAQSDIEHYKESEEKYKNDIQKLREKNMDLFLRVGEERDKKITQENASGIKDDEPEPRKYEDLFNEKGELK